MSHLTGNMTELTISDKAVVCLVAASVLFLVTLVAHMAQGKALKWILAFFAWNAGTLPPGPVGIPVISNLLMLRDPSENLLNISKRFGKTISVRLNGELFIVLHDLETAKAVFGNETSAGRDPQDLLRKYNHGKGLFMAEGSLWKEHRRFAVKTLRDLGMGKTWFEEAIIQEVFDLIAFVREQGGKPFDPKPFLTQSISNAVCALVFGKRFDRNDHRFHRLCNLFSKNGSHIAALAPIRFFPFLKLVPLSKYSSEFAKLLSNVLSLTAFIRSMITFHKEERLGDKHDAVKDYISAYLEEQKRQNGSATTAHSFTDEQLIFSVLDLFGAGSKTVEMALRWAFIHLLENPTVMHKVHAELSKFHLGKPITTQDKGLVKYCEATMMETQRLGASSISLLHSNIEAMEIEGFKIPKRSLIGVNHHGIHHDPAYFPDPDIFRPERFFDNHGDIVIPAGFVPFGIGKRACPGERLARMEFFLYFMNILRNFTLDYPPKQLRQPSSKRVESGLTFRVPLPFEIRLIPKSN